MCPYSTVVPSVVAAHLSPESGSTERSASLTHCTPTTGGKCVQVCGMQGTVYVFIINSLALAVKE